MSTASPVSDQVLLSQPRPRVLGLRRRKQPPPPAQERVVWVWDAQLRSVQRILLVVLAIVVILDFAASAGAALGMPYLLTRLLDGDNKLNVPTTFKTTVLLCDALAMLALSRLGRRTGDRFSTGWLLLSMVTGFAFVDESVYLHQSLGKFLAQHLGTSGPLEYAWTLVYFPFALIVAAVLAFHVRKLSAGTRFRVLATGVLYWAGAICFEPIKSEISENAGDGSLAFKLVAAVSDSVEMIGMTLLLIVLITHLARQAQEIRIRLVLE